MKVTYRYELLPSLNLRAPKAKVFFISIFLLFWPITSIEKIEVHRSFAEQASISTQRIFLESGSMRISIPRNHLTNLWFRGDDPKSAAVLAVVVYPELEGATARNIASILRPKGFDIGAVYFTNALEGSVILNSDNTWKRRPWYRGPGFELEAAEFGLWKVKYSEADFRIWFGATDTETVTVSCGDRFCRLTFFAEGYFWRVQMGRQLYPHWQDVTNKLRKIITVWVTAASEGKK